MKICSTCKSQNLKQIEIVTRGSFDVIEFPQGFAICPKSSKINKFLCLECGHIDFYIDDLEKFK